MGDVQRATSLADVGGSVGLGLQDDEDCHQDEE